MPKRRRSAHCTFEVRLPIAKGKLFFLDAAWVKKQKWKETLLPCHMFNAGHLEAKQKSKKIWQRKIGGGGVTVKQVRHYMSGTISLFFFLNPCCAYHDHSGSQISIGTICIEILCVLHEHNRTRAAMAQELDRHRHKRKSKWAWNTPRRQSSTSVKPANLTIYENADRTDFSQMFFYGCSEGETTQQQTNN